MTDLLVDDHLSAGCLIGAHRACQGDAWCMDKDCATDCSCSCHDDAEAVVA